jgi:hypothetical protein
MPTKKYEGVVVPTICFDAPLSPYTGSGPPGGLLSGLPDPPMVSAPNPIEQCSPICPSSSCCTPDGGGGPLPGGGVQGGPMPPPK